MMMATSGESVIGTAIAMAIAVHVGTMVGAAVGRMTTSNEPPGDSGGTLTGHWPVLTPSGLS